MNYDTEKEPVVLSATRCASTIIQRVGHYALYGKAGSLRKEHEYSKGDVFAHCSERDYTQ